MRARLQGVALGVALSFSAYGFYLGWTMQPVEKVPGLWQLVHGDEIEDYNQTLDDCLGQMVNHPGWACEKQ